MNRTEIANYALGVVGSPRIQSLIDGTTTANKIKAMLPVSESYVLRLHNWTSHLKREYLAQVASPAGSEYSYCYAIPPCSRFLGITDGEPYNVMGDKVYTDNNQAIGLYIGPSTEEYDDATLAEAIALHLAMRLAIDIADDQGKRQSIQQEFMLVLSQARQLTSEDGQDPGQSSGWWYP